MCDDIIIAADDDKFSQSASDGQDREDVERQKWQSLVPPLLDQNRPNVDDDQHQKKSVQSNDYVVLHRVDHELSASESSVLSGRFSGVSREDLTHIISI